MQLISKRRNRLNKINLLILLFKGSAVWKPNFVDTDIRLIQRFHNLVPVWLTTLLYLSTGTLDYCPCAETALKKTIDELPGHCHTCITTNIITFSLLPPWMRLTGSITTAFSRRSLSETEIKGCAATSRKVEWYDKTFFCWHDWPMELHTFSKDNKHKDERRDYKLQYFSY